MKNADSQVHLRLTDSGSAFLQDPQLIQRHIKVGDALVTQSGSDVSVNLSSFCLLLCDPG